MSGEHEMSARPPRTSFLSRLASAFVAPAEETEAEPIVATPRAIAVLAWPGTLRAAGAAVALAAAPSGPAVLAVHDGGEPSPVRAPSSPAARKLAERLVRRGHAATSTGRLVIVEAESHVEVGRLAAAAEGVPVVAAIGTPRDEQIDDLLRRQDRVLLVGGEDTTAVTDLALESLAVADIPARAFDGRCSAAAKALALSGTALSGTLRARIEEALR